MRVNPVFGTGIAKIAYGVISLEKSLRTIPSSSSGDGGSVVPLDFATSFFSTQKARIDSFWTLVKNTVPVPGDDKNAGSWTRWYTRRLRLVSFKASSVFWHITNQLAPAIDAVHPRFDIQGVAPILYIRICNPSPLIKGVAKLDQ